MRLPLPGSTPLPGSVLIVLAISGAVLTALCGLIYLLMRQQGRILTSQEEMRARLAEAEAAVKRLAEPSATEPAEPHAHPPNGQAARPAQPAGLALGAAAPDFRLPDLEGRLRTLADYRGKPAVLVFFNPECGFCSQLAPRLTDIPTTAPQVVVMSRGDKQANLRLARDHHWKADVLLEPNWDVATTYRTNATPTGYLIDADGRIASTLAVGGDGVLQLTRMLSRPAPEDDNGHQDLTAQALAAKQSAAKARAKAAGLAVTDSRIKRDGLSRGTSAPNFNLPDLQGKDHSLADLRGKRVVLVFSDPECGPCQTLAPSLQDLHETHGDLQVIVVSKGSPEANRKKASEHGLTFPVLLQKNWEVSREYAMFATPVGYLIDERGRIAKDVAVGGEAILALANGAKQAEPQRREPESSDS
jgi:peroxiredoxin